MLLTKIQEVKCEALTNLEAERSIVKIFCLVPYISIIFAYFFNLTAHCEHFYELKHTSVIFLCW